MASPSPVPFPSLLVVKNGLKILARTSAGIPVPVSPIRIITLFPEALFEVDTVNSPPSGMASFALFARLRRICSICDSIAFILTPSHPVSRSITTSSGKTSEIISETFLTMRSISMILNSCSLFLLYPRRPCVSDLPDSASSTSLSAR